MKKATIKKSTKKKQPEVTKVTKKTVKSAKVLVRHPLAGEPDGGKEKKKITIKKPAFALASAKATVDKKATALSSKVLKERRETGKEVKKKISKPSIIFKRDSLIKGITQKIVLDKSRATLPEKSASKKVAQKEVLGKPDRYFEAVGRRKTAVARVRLFTRGEKTILVNDKFYKEYFPLSEIQQIAVASLKKMNCLEKFKILVKVKGGGYHAQAEAVRHGIARALVKFNSNFRKRLRKAGYLTRDPRMRERKKFGLKRARRAPQWAKR